MVKYKINQLNESEFLTTQYVGKVKISAIITNINKDLFEWLVVKKQLQIFS